MAFIIHIFCVYRNMLTSEFSLCKQMKVYLNRVGYLLVIYASEALREKCPYSELFWSLFWLIDIKYGEIFSPNEGKHGPE